MKDNDLIPSAGYEARLKSGAKRTLIKIFIVIAVIIAIIYIRSPKFYLFERYRGSSETNVNTNTNTNEPTTKADFKHAITLPEFPVTITKRGSFNDEVLASYQIDKLDYEILETRGEQYIIKLSISGKCTYISTDDQYRSPIEYKLYNSNEAVISSGLFYLPLLAEGDKFENIKTSEFSLPPDKYSIVFLEN